MVTNLKCSSSNNEDGQGKGGATFGSSCHLDRSWMNIVAKNDVACLHFLHCKIDNPSRVWSFRLMCVISVFFPDLKNKPPARRT